MDRRAIASITRRSARRSADASRRLTISRARAISERRVGPAAVVRERDPGARKMNLPDADGEPAVARPELHEPSRFGCEPLQIDRPRLRARHPCPAVASAVVDVVAVARLPPADRREEDRLASAVARRPDARLAKGGLRDVARDRRHARDRAGDRPRVPFLHRAEHVRRERIDARGIRKRRRLLRGRRRGQHRFGRSRGASASRVDSRAISAGAAFEHATRTIIPIVVRGLIRALWHARSRAVGRT